MADEVTSAGDYDLRALTLETAQTEPVTLRIVLEWEGVRFTLELSVTPEPAQYAVEFADEDGNVLFTRYALYGGTVTLTADDPTDARVWQIPDAIYEPMTLRPVTPPAADEVPDDADEPDEEPDET